MRGLIVKDILAMKKEIKTYAVLLILYSGFTIAIGQTNLMLIMGILFGMSIVTVSMAYDERAGWNKYALGMKINFKEIVFSKYILGFLCIFVMSILMIITEIILKKSSLEINGTLNLILILGVGLISITIPLCIKFGVERGKIISLVFIMGPGVIGIVFEESIEPILGKFLEIANRYGIIIGCLIGIGIMLVSMAVSMQFYKNKEF